MGRIGVTVKLYDVLTLEKPAETPAYNADWLERAKKQKNHWISWNELLTSGHATKMSREDQREVSASIGRDLASYRTKILLESGSLPETLLFPSESDPFSMFARSPSASLESCRKLADDFGFVIIPLEYYSGPEKYTSDLRPVENFDRASGKEFTTYVMCPVRFYSPEKHVRSENDLEIYSGVFAQAFMALGMSIPLFRQLSREVVDLGNRQTRTEVRLNNIEGELSNLSRRISALENSEAERQRVAFAFAPKARVMAEDPLALAVPNKIGIMGDGNAKVGPCWGPDFEEALATKRGYKKQANKKIAVWDGRS